ncbi:1,4-dihydroxy-2-naphthoate polyprenyltransferase [Geosporobacter ferrireducens]|uniref:1,4-dihydroxy-2-naphthoate polyprenyltransferase n=1 Tax=Geosporobacter ferrireducens TaxID=1424294 RepID=A0A1D8GIP1_9FIRM|nr:1,4-dihydroxy-2-naphthoate polyprenyltransferase [Geosporobacter ferrireducens]AOT70780.1 1,4-dihydroxy-2-naphthoate polyprenyltransferase [Geosporobacter ferrireducens]MTI57270.1 1,4-dihydroxy-2-naphthoate polyprenyltransferase [Geosporobacter ferrireducens]
MSLSCFLKLVEIQTKVASAIPFSLGTLYALYRFQQFNLKNFLLMFISLLAFDMVTTVINNYLDYKKAIKTHGFNYETHNAIVKYDLKESIVIATIAILLAIAVCVGFLLFLNTNKVVLLLGVISFIVGVLYSFGPMPISRMPLGEIFSGLFMGFVIVFISAYIHVYDKNIITLLYHDGMLRLEMNIVELLYLFLMSVPAVMGIANIMLANNICDIEDDMENKRYTLPIYIGKENALKLFKALYYITYADIILLLIVGVEPMISLLMLLTLIPVRKNLKIFYERQTKRDTFILAVKNFIIINVSRIFTIGTALLINFFLIH